MTENLDKITVIFLAAGEGKRMRSITNIPKPLINIGSQAALALELKPFLEFGFKNFSFILGNNGDLIEYYMRANYGNLNLQFHYIKEALGTAHSLYQVRHLYPSNSIIVCHADNIYLKEHFYNIDLSENFIFVNNDPQLKPFAYVELKNNTVMKAVEKPKKFFSPYVISGLFYFRDSKIVWEATEYNFRYEKKSGLEWSISDVLDTLSFKSKHKILAHMIDTPIHFGTPDEYERTIHSYDDKSPSISRAMNDITFYEDKKGKKCVRKESNSEIGKQNLYSEIKYLNSLPKNISSHFPKILNYTYKFYEMEHEKGEEISNLCQKNKINIKDLDFFFKSLFNILKKDFHTKNVKAINDAVHYEVFEKTQIRLREFQSAMKLDGNFIDINGLNCINPIYLINELIEINKKKKLIFVDKFTFIHGDLNLTNVLYDLDTKKITLIDPRGKYGNKISQYGDPSYDLMRILACFEHGYDSIAKGNFKLSFKGTKILIDVKKPRIYDNYIEILKKMIQDYFPSIPPVNYEIQSIFYFLNLLPFHSDSVERSLTFYYWGTFKLNNYFNIRYKKYENLH